MKRILALAIAAAFAGGLAGCSEREQTALYKDGKYRGKPDTRPWDNTPPAYGSESWKQGDHVTWENQVRTRSAAQNENRRIGH
ncbi:MAG TPA: hypothetical protein VLF65_07570 [Burkholderiales bacterium]|jgi:hypothetical protein|nr:hypothetical protein [Burkholderiales bacterium]